MASGAHQWGIVESALHPVLHGELMSEVSRVVYETFAKRRNLPNTELPTRHLYLATLGI